MNDLVNWDPCSVDDSFEFVTNNEEPDPPGVTLVTQNTREESHSKTLTSAKLDEKNGSGTKSPGRGKKPGKDSGSKEFKILIRNIPLNTRAMVVCSIFRQWGSCGIVDSGCADKSQWLILSFCNKESQRDAIAFGNRAQLKGNKLEVTLPSVMERKAKSPLTPPTKSTQHDRSQEVDEEMKDDIVGQLGWGWALLLFVLCIVPWGRPLLFIFISFGIFWRLRNGVKRLRNQGRGK